MYNSKEIRWFTRSEAPHITQWFAAKGLGFAPEIARTDFYLCLPNTSHLAIKLREGNIEIKQRSGLRTAGQLTAGARGFFENWTKWSFNAAKDDALAAAITGAPQHNWLQVYKERIGVKLVPGKDGALKTVNIKERAPFGCQAEYTRLLVNKVEWFTFALEWFGDGVLEPGEAFYADILGAVTLQPETSMGYAEFLHGQE